MSDEQDDRLREVLHAAARNYMGAGGDPVMLGMALNLTEEVIKEAHAQSELSRVLAGVPPLDEKENHIHQIGTVAGMLATLKVLLARGYFGSEDQT